MLYASGISGDFHREVIHTDGSSGVCKTVEAISVVVDAVARFQPIEDAVQREVENPFFDGYVLARTVCMREKRAGIDAGIQGGSHELELDTG
jgi:hypothetical protein